MEEDRELKHSCKLCNKSFACGRSLGGHMRSHMINNNSTEYPKKKLPSVTEMAAAASYVFRENPKKTRRLADTSGDTSLICYDNNKKARKESVKPKTLFGSMEKETSLEDQDSWTSKTNQKLVMDSQSDNETAAPNRRRRSKRRITRYMATANSSSFSNNNHNNNNASSSVSEIEQQQEEVAMCLMMLSRDMGPPRVCLNSVAESSDNNSVFLEAKKDAGETPNLKSGFVDETENKSSKLHHKLGSVEENSQLGSSKKLVSDGLKKKSANGVASEDFDKRSKFECITCNKIFHSYQALGGHRASHKKIKGCFATKIDNSNEENSIETQLHLSHDPTADSNKIVNENSVDADCEEKFDQTSTIYGPKKRHECPICLKVFSSGQALGGHKRSHLLNVTEAAATGSNSTNIVIDKPMPEIRNILDLNLPALAEEESSNGHLEGFKPWWIDSTHKHEPLLGLISN